MRKWNFERYRQERLLWLIESEQEKLDFFYERKYSRTVCGRFFPPRGWGSPDARDNRYSYPSALFKGRSTLDVSSAAAASAAGSSSTTDFFLKSESGISKSKQGERETEPVCRGCGYKQSEHERISQPPRWTMEDSSKWRKVHHLVPLKYPESSFKMRITDEVSGLEKLANIAVLSSDTHPAIVLDLLCKKWRVAIPDIVVSVVGTVDHTPLTPNQLKSFKRGFCRTLNSCRSWVVGGGTLHGVDAVITECVKEMQYLEWLVSSAPKLFLIAFTNWDCIDAKLQANNWFFHHKPQLEQQQQQQQQIKKQQTLLRQKTTKLKIKKKEMNPYPYFIRKRKATFDEFNQTLTASLNPFFSQIIAIQGGVKGQLNQELEVRSTTEEFLSKAFDTEVKGGNPGMGIPTVQILIGGHLGDLERVARSLACQTPVVVCQGSGGISDVILCALRLSAACEGVFSDSSRLKPYHETILVNQLRAFGARRRGEEGQGPMYDGSTPGAEGPGSAEENAVPGGKDQTGLKSKLYSNLLIDLTPQIVNLRTIVKNRKLITVYRVDLPPDVANKQLDHCILRALLTGATVQKQDPIALALKWNRCDEVVQEILLAEGQDINLRHNINELVTSALLDGKLEFLQLFTDLGFEFSRYLTRSRIEFLFESRIETHNYAWNIFASQVKINKELQAKNAGLFHGREFPITVENVYFALTRFCGVKPVIQTVRNAQNEEIFHDPARELFLWSVLSCDLPLAEMFWKASKTPLALALMATIMCRQCNRFISRDEDDYQEKFVKFEKAFLQNALQFIDKAWTSNDLMALQLVSRPISSLSGIRIVDIAYYIGCKDFLAHPCVQVYVEKSWKSGLKMKFFHAFKAFFFIPVRLLMLPLCNFSEYFDSFNPDGGSGGQSDTLTSPTPTCNSQVDEVDTETFLLKYKDSRPSVFNNGSLIYDRRKLTAITRSQQDVRTSNTSIQISTIEVPTQDEPPISTKNNSVLKSVLKFYTSSISKFLISLITYLTYLFLISNVVLYESKTPTILLKEKMLFVFNIALLLQSIQLFFNPRVFFGFKVQLFCYCEWNLVGICCIFLGFLGITLKFIDEETDLSLVDICHCCYCLSCFLAWVRLISFYILNSTVGPLWIMLRKMLVEAVCFLSLLGVVTLAAGITLQVCMNAYDYTDPYSGTFQWLVLRPYFMFNGQRFVNNVLGSVADPPPGTQLTAKYVKERLQFTSLYMWLLILFLSVGTALMLNLLIALFNEVFKFINQRSQFEWKAENFSLQREYSDRPVLPAPLSIFESIYKLLCSRNRNDENPSEKFSYKNESEDEKLLAVFQNKWAGEVLAEKRLNRSLEETVRYTLKSADKQRSRINDFDIIMKEMFRLYQNKKRRDREKQSHENEAKQVESNDEL